MVKLHEGSCTHYLMNLPKRFFTEDSGPHPNIKWAAGWTFLVQGSHTILKIKFHYFSHDFFMTFHDLFEQLLHLFYAMLSKLLSTYVVSAEVIIFQ